MLHLNTDGSDSSSSSSSSSDSDTDDKTNERHQSSKSARLEAKMKHPSRLAENLWFNDPDEVGVLYRVSQND